MLNEQWRRYVAEFFGTYALVFVGAGAVLASQTGDFGILGVALAHGLVLMCVVYSMGHISGAHVNPAVTIATWATGHMKTGIAFGYVVAQLLGSVAAAGFLKLFLFPGVAGAGMGAPVLADGVTPFAGIMIEAMLTFFLVWVIMGVAVDSKNTNSKGASGLAIGMVLAFDILVGGALTGGAMNPARAFGPTLLAGGFDLSNPVWTSHFVYWVGPILGGLVAAVIYQYVFLKGKK